MERVLHLQDEPTLFRDLSYHILIISDSHLFESREEELFGVNTYTALKTTTDHIRDRNREYDLLVALGDLAEDGSEMAYRDFHALTGNLAGSVIWVKGNHDNFDNTGAEQFKTFCRPDVHFDTWHFIFLDTSITGRGEGRLKPAEIDRLKHFLESWSDEHVLVFMHHQPVLVGSGFIDELALENSALFLDIVSGYPSVRAVIFGHVHQRVDISYKGIRMLSVPAASMQFKPGSGQLDFDELRHGYMTVALFPGGRLETTVVLVDPGS